MQAEQNSIQPSPAADPRDDAAHADAPSGEASGQRTGGLFRKTMVRGESSVASVGIALAAILLCAMAASGGWVMRTQQAASAAARETQFAAVTQLICRSAEALLAQGDLSAVQRLLIETGPNCGLAECRVQLPDGQVIAAIDWKQVTAPRLPDHWPNGRAEIEAAVVPGDDSPSITLPMNIAGHGPATLLATAAPSQPIDTYWEAQTGVGVIGATAMLALLLVYRRARTRLKAVGAIREALLELATSTGPADARVGADATLLLSPGLGPEAMAWNELIAERERGRKQSIADRARAALGRRRQGKGDLEAACDAMSQGLLLVDERHSIKYANGAAAAFLHADRGQLAGADIGQFLQVENVVEAVRGVASGSVRRRIAIDVEGAESGGQGGNGVLRFSIRPVRREDSASAMVIIEDITQQRAAEEARHNFVAQATHELRTPLTNIRLYVETAIDEGENDPATRAKCLNVINGETRRLERIVGEMLSVAEIEAGSFKAHFDDVRLDALFAELVEDFREPARDKKIALAFKLPPKFPIFTGDRDKVVLAIHNLIGNALKYTPSGGQVTVSVEVDSTQVRVAVQDTGIGISEQEQDRVFERFYRAKDPRVERITGTGLGLTLAREVARLHGGDVTVDSQLDKGSTFTVALPLKAAA